MTCEHGFVSYDDSGSTKFLCNDCGARFLSYPGAISPAVVEASEQRVMKEFREGILSFSNALKQTQWSIGQFKEAMSRAFPLTPIYEDHFTIGITAPARKVVGYEPSRTSCYKEVDDFVGSPDTTTIDIKDIRKKFTDIISAQEVRFQNEHVMLITFQDESIQRVDVNFTTFLDNRGGTYRWV
jgi:hypothetical protein